MATDKELHTLRPKVIQRIRFLNVYWFNWKAELEGERDVGVGVSSMYWLTKALQGLELDQSEARGFFLVSHVGARAQTS